MEAERRQAALEAILFAMGEAVEIARLSQALEIPEEEVLLAVQELEERYEAPGSGLQIHRYDNAVQLSTRGEYYEYLIRTCAAPKKPVLTNALLETLSIIAYRQPVTRMDVEHIRGVNSDHAISRLVEYDLVREVGRRDAPGRPLLFGTTEQFLRSFGISSLEDLPRTDAVMMAEFRAQAEEEAGTRVDV